MRNQKRMFEFDFEIDGLGKPRSYFTRSQWRWKGRMVDARDRDAMKIITTNGGQQLRLFSYDQTVADTRPHDAEQAA